MVKYRWLLTVALSWLIGTLVCFPAFSGQATALPSNLSPANGAELSQDVAPTVDASSEIHQPFDVEAATESYLSRLSGEKREQSDNYFVGGYWLQLWNFLFGLGVAWLLLGTRLSAKMRDLAQKVGRWKTLHTALYAAQYLLLTTLISFPLAIYENYFREHKYGLANQNFGGWLGEQMTVLLVELILLPIVMVVLYTVFRQAPRTWWIWGAFVSVALLVVLLLIGPVFIAPLFNEYLPLEDQATVEPILSMARGSGVEVDKIYQFDASKQSKRVSANVSGIFGTMRISLNDNLLQRCDLAGVKAVMGHEIGHYVLNHVYEMILFFIVLLVGAFAFVRFTFDRLVARRGPQWGISGIGDVAGMPLLLVLLSVYFFLMTPVLNTFIRTNEVEADVFGLNIAREPEGFAETALMLSEYRKIDPGPIEEWIFYDHPSGRARIHMAMQWKAENLAKE